MRRWLGSRRVYTKILIVAGVAIVGTALVGVLALIGIGDLRTTRDAEVGKSVPYIGALNQVALTAKAAANDERGFLLAGNASFRAEALGRQAGVNTALQDALAAAGPGERATVASIQAATDAWFTALQAEFATFETDRTAAVAVSFGANRDLRKVYEGLLGQEITRASAALVAGKDFGNTADRTRLSVIAALALAVALALYVGRIIVQPLGRVSRVLQAVAAGDLTQDARVEQRDEVGTMAGALRQATTLRGTIATLAEHSVVLASASEELATTSKQSA